MSHQSPGQILNGKKALVVGIANDSSIAYGCAKAFRELGAEVAITYLDEKSRPYVEPLAIELGAPLFMPLDVSRQGQLEAVFEKISTQWRLFCVISPTRVASSTTNFFSGST